MAQLAAPGYGFINETGTIQAAVPGYGFVNETAGASPNVTVALTGQAATFSLGALAVGIAISLSGQALTFSQGTVTASTGVFVSLTGTATAYNQGVLPPAVSAVLAGQAQTFSLGTLAVGHPITTPPLKNNTGTVLASISGWTVNVYNASTGALVVQKTGLSTDSSGVISFTDAAITGGTYSYEPVHATYGRRLPTVTT